MAEVRIGTSGWLYPPWRGPFYPAKLAQARWLEHYAGRFDTAEINGTFYRLPTQATVARWREATPPGFVFSWKASRFITHMKRLRDPADSLNRVFAPMEALGRKFGPVLFQLPPQMRPDLPRLSDFLALLPADHRHVIEFRDPAWYTEPVFAKLAEHRIALCISDHHHAPAPWIATAPFAYVRGHGPDGRYAGSYSDGTLKAWAVKIAGWRAEGRDVFTYFDNDVGCAAPEDARRLKRLLGMDHGQAA
jgi:uncharacterized protein YecE (DUF72 family)